MNANLMSRTAIGLLVVSTTIPVASAQDCQTGDLVEDLARIERLLGKHRLDPEKYDQHCWARDVLRERARFEAPGAIAVGVGLTSDEPKTRANESKSRHTALPTADTNAVNIAQLRSALSAAGYSSDYFAINAGGPPAAALWTNSMAIGPNSVAGASGAVAIGNGATSLFDNAYAIGANANTLRNFQFMIGTRDSNYTLPGLVNPQSRMLQSGALQLVTVDESGTLAGDGGATVSNFYSTMAAMNEGISYLGQLTSDHALALTRGEQDRTVLSGGLASLDRRVTEHSTSLSDLRDRISEFVHLPEEVDTLAEQVTENSESLVDLERSLAEGVVLSEETAQHLDALDGQVTSNTRETRQNTRSIEENRAAIEGNSASIERLEETASNGAVRFDAIETSMSTHATRMDDMDDSISAHADRISENADSVATVKSIASENQARIARNQAGLVAQGEAISMLQSDFEQLGLNVYGLAQTVAHQAEQIETNKGGIAIANALAGASWLQANETTALTLNAGYFEGSSALAISGTRRLHNHWSANFAVGTDTKRGDIGARAGLRLGW